MADRALRVELVSPERPLYAGRALAVVAETADGEAGILPGHAAMVAVLGTGAARVRSMRESGNEGTDLFAIRGGFLTVAADRVTLLVTDAVRGEEVDPDRVRGELEKTLEALRHPKSDEEFARLLDDRRWAESRLRVSEVHRTGPAAR